MIVFDLHGHCKRCLDCRPRAYCSKGRWMVKTFRAAILALGIRVVDA